MRTTSLSKRTAIAMIAVAAVASACRAESASAPTPSGLQVALPTSDWTPDQMRFALSVRGQLFTDGACIRMRESSTDVVTTPVWPKGTVAYTRDGSITVYTPDGRPIARTGDEVTYDGGYGPAPYPGECTRGQLSFWLVQDDL